MGSGMVTTLLVMMATLPVMVTTLWVIVTTLHKGNGDNKLWV